VAQAIILATSEVEITGRMVAYGQLGQKIHKTPYQSMAGHGGMKIMVQAGPGIK
jgi:hypothetical protein